MSNIKFSIFAITLLFTSMLHSSAQTLDQIIKKHVQAIGGKKNWEKINSIKLSGIMVVRGTDMTYSDLVLNGKGERQDYAQFGKSSFQILTTTNGWSYVPLAGRRAKSEAVPEVIVKQLQNRLDIQGPFIDYKDKGVVLVYLGKGDAHGVDCYKIQVSYPGANPDIFYLDAVNYYHVLTTQFSKEEGKEIDAIKYSNFQKLPEGIVVPMTIEEEVGTKNIKTVEINIPVVDSIAFNPTKY